VTFAAFVSIIAFLWLVEPPVWRFTEDAGRERRAAVAIRGIDPPFVLWVSKVFTLPYLERYYAVLTTLPICRIPTAGGVCVRASGALTSTRRSTSLSWRTTTADEKWMGAIDPVLRQKHKAGLQTPAAKTHRRRCMA